MSELLGEIKSNLEKVQEINFLFGRFSSSYDNHMYESNHYSVLNKLIFQVKDKLRPGVIDFACGTGHLALEVSQYVSGPFYLLDFQDKMLHVARHKVPNDDFIIRKLDLSQHLYIKNFLRNEDRVTTALCSFGLYWMSDPVIFLQNIFNSLSDEGNFFLFEENFYFEDDFMPAFSLSGDWLKKLGALETVYGIDEIIRICKGVGFKFIEKISKEIDNRHELVCMHFHKGKV